MKIKLTSEEGALLEKLLMEELEYNIKATAKLSTEILIKLLKIKIECH